MSSYERGEERLPETTDLRGLMCDREGCGKTMRFVYTLANVGSFCSEACRERAKIDPWLVAEDAR